MDLSLQCTWWGCSKFLSVKTRAVQWVTLHKSFTKAMWFTDCLYTIPQNITSRFAECNIIKAAVSRVETIPHKCSTHSCNWAYWPHKIRQWVQSFLADPSWKWYNTATTTVRYHSNSQLTQLDTAHFISVKLSVYVYVCFMLHFFCTICSSTLLLCSKLCWHGVCLLYTGGW